jgi:hypothetical protein
MTTTGIVSQTERTALRTVPSNTGALVGGQSYDWRLLRRTDDARHHEHLHFDRAARVWWRHGAREIPHRGVSGSSPGSLAA